MATLWCILQIGAEPLPETEMEVEASLVDRDGWTVKNFDPAQAPAPPLPGFQRQVRN